MHFPFSVRKFFSFKQWARFFIVTVLLFALLTNILWIWRDQSPPLWDMAGHSERALYFAHQLQNGHLRTLFRYETIYPPLTYTVTGVFFLLTGWHKDIPQYSLQFFLLVFLLSVYGTSLELFGDRKSAALSALLVFAYPLLTHFTRVYDLDFPLAAMVALNLFVLLKSKYFTKRGWTFFWAVTLSLALLTKWTAGIFLFGPTLLTLGRIIHDRLWRRIHMTTLLGIGVIFGILIVPWYAEHFRTIRASMIGTRLNIFSVPTENLWSVKNILFYPRYVVRAVSWPLALFAAWGMCVAMKRQRRSYADMFLFACIVPAYLVMTFVFYSKEVRYILPLLSALAIFSVQGFGSTKGSRPVFRPVHNLHRLLQKSIRPLTASMLVLWASVLWVETSWHTHILNTSAKKFWHLEKTYGLQNVLPKDPRYGFTYPTDYQSVIQEIPPVIFTDADTHIPNWNDTALHPLLHVAVVPNSIFLNAQQVQYNTHLWEYKNFHTTASLHTEFSLSTRLRSSDWKNTILRADYLITKTGDQGPKIWSPHLEEIASEEQNSGSATFGHFELVHSWSLVGIETKKGVPAPQEMRLYRRVLR